MFLNGTDKRSAAVRFKISIRLTPRICCDIMVKYCNFPTAQGRLPTCCSTAFVKFLDSQFSLEAAPYASDIHDDQIKGIGREAPQMIWPSDLYGKNVSQLDIEPMIRRRFVRKKTRKHGQNRAC